MGQEGLRGVKGNYHLGTLPKQYGRLRAYRCDGTPREPPAS